MTSGVQNQPGDAERMVLGAHRGIELEENAKAQAVPRELCDHICLKDADHVGVTPHFYGYEIPSPRGEQRWPATEWGEVSGALADSGLAGDLRPSEAICNLRAALVSAVEERAAAVALLRAVDEDVRPALMWLEEVVLSLPGRWNDPLVPDECAPALQKAYDALAAFPFRGEA